MPRTTVADLSPGKLGRIIDTGIHVRPQFTLFGVIPKECSEKLTDSNAKTDYVTSLLPPPTLLRLHMADIFTRCWNTDGYRIALLRLGSSYLEIANADRDIASSAYSLKAFGAPAEI